eukprot:c14951_g1_i1.p1 GENE.c14951_g1_i1~~c14951_g1_i1.p1  ORF type:complete len:267 (-),score=76.24 c14951_g1_i1:25-825(-)
MGLLGDSTMAERIAHFLALGFVLIGVVIVWIVLDTNASDVYSNSDVYFIFATGCLVSLFLMINCGRAFPTLLPITLGLLYYWYPKGIDLGQEWSYHIEHNNIPHLSKSNAQLLLAGTVLTLFGTGAGVLIEFFFPKKFSQHPSVLLKFFAVLAGIVSLIGLLVLWIFNGRHIGSSLSSLFQRLSIQGLIALIFSLDECFHPDVNLVIAVLFMCTYTACESLQEGVSYNSAIADKDTRYCFAGCLVLGAGLALMAVIVGLLSHTAPK